MRAYCTTQGSYSGLFGDLNGKEIQKEEINVYGRLVHFAAQQKLIQYCKATILQ